jgi:hypothetical protein
MIPPHSASEIVSGTTTSRTARFAAELEMLNIAERRVNAAYSLHVSYAHGTTGE